MRNLVMGMLAFLVACTASPGAAPEPCADQPDGCFAVLTNDVVAPDAPIMVALDLPPSATSIVRTQAYVVGSPLGFSRIQLLQSTSTTPAALTAGFPVDPAEQEALLDTGSAVVAIQPGRTYWISVDSTEDIDVEWVTITVQ